MKRTAFAIAVAALALVGVSGISQAVPIAPLPAGIATSHDNVTQVQWGYYHRGPYWRYRHRRHCWRGYYGRIHCRYYW